MLRSKVFNFNIDIPKILVVYPKRASTNTNDSKVEEEALIENVNIEAEQEIERKRNKSGLREKDFNRLHGRMPYDEPACALHSTLKYQRKLYGMYGKSSTIDPRLCWMSKEELASKLEYDSLAESRSILDMVAEIKEKRAQEKEEIRRRDATVARNVAKINEWKRELTSKLAKKQAEADAAKAKKEKLIEEVRRHFGFKVDPKDDRFREMLEKKEKEQKKAEKMAKKSAKEAQMLELLKQQSLDISNTLTKKQDSNEAPSENTKETN